jgi:serine phosphatase RsbU (regulator of sigma subunit)
MLPHLTPEAIRGILRFFDKKPNKTVHTAYNQPRCTHRREASQRIRRIDQFLHTLRMSWRSVRWRMLIIFAFFSVVSASLITALAVAAVNVVIRRECAYLIEEKLNAMVENQRSYTEMIASDHMCIAPHSKPVAASGAADAVWPGSHTSLFAVSQQSADRLRPDRLHGRSFTGIIVEQGHIAIRSFTIDKEGLCANTLITDTALDSDTMKALSRAAGLEMSDGQAIALRPYRRREGGPGEIAANFIPGSRRAVPVVITVTNWETARPEDWVICTVRLSYARTMADLSRMGLQPASWLVPMGGLSLALLGVYAGGLLLSTRLSRQIVSAIDSLSLAAQRVGKGDFSVTLPTPGHDQLSMLASSFNTMTRDLHSLRRQERQAALLEWELSLAREVQEHLFPRLVTSAGVDVSGMNLPARIVSGDMYGIFHFSPFEVGILCADLSGKGVAAAIMMAHMQGLLDGRLLLPNHDKSRPSPAEFIQTLNSDLHGRFGDNRYATLFYGQYDCRTGIMRYINAGHCPPILISPSREAITISQGDVPVGLFSDVRYQEFEVALPSNSSLLVYTDGVTDALDCDGEAFGDSRLLVACRALPSGVNASTIIASIAGRVVEWSNGVDQVDDITLMALTVE